MAKPLFEWDPNKATRNLRTHGISFEKASMRKQHKSDDYDLREEYDFSKMAVVPKGRYAPKRREGSNVALLAPDIAKAFPTDESVNNALRLIIQAAEIPTKHKPKAKSRTATRTSQTK